MLDDYGFSQHTMTIHCNNSNAINISKNDVQHSITKHIYKVTKSLIQPSLQ
jgi:hypothetical protein